MTTRRRRSCYSFSSSSPSSSDDDESTTSNMASEHKLRKRHRQSRSFAKLNVSAMEEQPNDCQNVLLKILNRERNGVFARKATSRSHQKPFDVVPNRLSFCLKDIVPICYLSGHVFMGLTVCGQFLLSYKVVVCEEPDFNQFLAGSYKYELFFWIYRPHQLLRKYYSICLFDDHGVDNVKKVTMCQWFSSARTLIVHGASEFENEDSFVSIVAVPRLGCLDCRQMRDEHFFANQEDASSRSAALCITCNLTIHTKYTRSESDPQFDPRVNLHCPQRLILFTNGLIHMLNVDLQLNKPPKSYSTSLSDRYVQRRKSTESTDAVMPVVNPKMSVATIAAPHPLPQDSVIAAPPTPPTRENIVARIIADFDECETSTNEGLPVKSAATKHFEELVINTNSTVPVSARTSIAQVPQRGRFLTYRRTTNQSTSSHIPTTSNPATQPKQDVAAASRAYEFSEDTEKYEKISSFRKRRLADKKYEFSEDNSENIIPFAKLRMRRQNGPLDSRLISSPTRSVDSGLLHQQQPTQQQHTHRASPSHGFRSPCGSPVGNRFIIMSPPSGARGTSATSQLYGRSPTYKPFSSSPRHQIVHTKRSTGHYFDASDIINSGAIYSPLLLSPRSDAEFELFRHNPTSATTPTHPLTEVKPSNISADSIPLLTSALAPDKAVEPKPVCAKKLVRHYVEEDDTTSVITSEEDDCISPGYHTSLPVEVHGACYSGMQLVSAGSYQQRLLRNVGTANQTTPTMNAAVLVTQHTFDLETLTYHIANRLCVINSKQYGFFYDWACEPVHICPLSAILTSLLIVNFTARDTPPPGAAPCLNCSNREQLDCAFHRRHFECRSLFTWNVESGDWTILDYGEMAELPPSVLRKRNATSDGGSGAASASGAPSELTRIVRKMAREMSRTLRDDDAVANWSGLYTLDSCVERSKEVLRDQHNSIEFYRGANGVGAGGGLDDDDDDDTHERSFIDDDTSDSSDFE